MAKELSDIITRAAEVRDATLSAENTAERVGGVLCDLLEYLNEAYTLSGTNKTAIATRRPEIIELTERLKGRSGYSFGFSQFSRKMSE